MRRAVDACGERFIALIPIPKLESIISASSPAKRSVALRVGNLPKGILALDCTVSRREPSGIMCGPARWTNYKRLPYHRSRWTKCRLMQCACNEAGNGW